MKITFLGAAHEVTGSCTLLTVAGRQILVDCGMEQGQDLFENQEIPVSPSLIDAVLLTHAHIDHSGMIPMLYANGFRGDVFATGATCKLCNIMLRDSAHIQEFEAKWRNRKAKRAGEQPYVPLYTLEDVEGVLKHFKACDYNADYTVMPQVTVSFTDAGHLLGSASVTLCATENGETTRMVFSGDIGNLNKPILRDPQYLTNADYVMMESTYGDRSHATEKPDYVRNLADVIQRTFDRGGNVVIPAFAVGRTQEMLFFIRQIKEQGLVTGHGNFPVVVDSPLAIEATKLFGPEALSCYDEETRELLQNGVNPIQFPGLYTAVSADESRMINADKASKVIISASGMCEAGRVRHHLKHNLWREESTILFVGYQSVNTIGRLLLDGATEVRLFGETITVKAEIAQIDSISSHADDNGLLRWVSSFSPPPKRVFVVHGDEGSCEAFTARLQSEKKLDAVAPFSGDAWDLTANRQVEYGPRRRLTKKKTASDSRRSSTAYLKLLAAAKRLERVVEACRGYANKDLAKFTSQIHALCDKWSK